MIGDNIVVHEDHIILANDIIKQIDGRLSSKHIIAIGGESGSGKSTLALALEKRFNQIGKKAFVFHLDDYFKLPPLSNHNHRLENIENVGCHEINISLLQRHISEIKSGAHTIEKPIVFYHENCIKQETIDISNIDIFIIEGTYTLLADADTKIFIDRNYLDTFTQRQKRARDPMTPFIEKVLEIEHKIIKAHKKFAHIIIGKSYDIIF